jgi:hypothetical protein
VPRSLLADHCSPSYHHAYSPDAFSHTAGHSSVPPAVPRSYMTRRTMCLAMFIKLTLQRNLSHTRITFEATSNGPCPPPTSARRWRWYIRPCNWCDAPFVCRCHGEPRCPCTSCGDSHGHFLRFWSLPMSLKKLARPLRLGVVQWASCASSA